MYQFIIWTIDGNVRTAYILEENYDYECQVLEHDPFVKEYGVYSL